MQVLNDMVNLLVQNLPSVFPADSTADDLSGRQLNGLAALTKKYEGTQYEPVVKALAAQTFIFSNSRQIHQTAGSYVAAPYFVFRFYISAFLGECRTIRRDELLAYRGDKAIKTFRGILLHELRHMMQSYAYPNYYYGRKEEDYRTSAVEIDAAWMHHLQDFDVNAFANVNDYMTAVIDSFARYKSLNARQIRHFKAKTARYYYDTKHQRTDNLAVPAKARLQRRRDAFNQRFVARFAAIGGGDIDLRNLPGYNPDSKRFFLNPTLTRGVSAIIAKNAPVSLANAPIVFLLFALVTPPDEVAEVLRHLQAVQKITLADALTNVDTTFVDGFDTQAIAQQIQRVFG